MSTATDTAVKPAMMRVAAAADYVALSERRIRELVETGELQRRWIGKRQYRILTSSLDAYVASLPQVAPHA